MGEAGIRRIAASCPYFSGQRNTCAIPESGGCPIWRIPEYHKGNICPHWSMNELFGECMYVPQTIMTESYELTDEELLEKAYEEYERET
jgi:hypothetical protein